VSQRTLIVRGPTYFSDLDESAFFDWLQSIPCVKGVTGHVRDLHIALKRPATLRDLTELESLLRRYRMPLKALEQLRSAKNAGWFQRFSN